MALCFGAGAATEAKKPQVDVALSARVLTWDPDRKDGCRNGRLDEFPAEELYLERDVAPGKGGSYVVPVKNGKGCIGLEWLELRHINEIGVQFADAGRMPSTDGVQVEYWLVVRPGDANGPLPWLGTKWQGEWKPLPGKIAPNGDHWTYAIDRGGIDPSGTLKVRWIFPMADKPVAIRRMWAFTDSNWATTDLTIQVENAKAGQTARVQMYNGAILDAKGRESVRAEWDARKPLRLKVRYCVTTEWMTDRTVLRLAAPGGACGIAVDDVLANGCVYAKDYGLFVASDASKKTLSDYKEQIASKQTVLQRVHAMPDQTFEQAMAHISRPDSHLGATAISLACDNHKFVVSRDSTIDWDNDPSIYDCYWEGWPPKPAVGYHLKVEYASGRGSGVTRHLQNDWLPIPIISLKDGDVSYKQRTFVTPYDKTPLPAGAPVWMNRKPLCVSEFTIENPGSQPANVSLRLRILSDKDSQASVKVASAATGALFEDRGKLLAAVNTTEANGLKSEIASGVCTISGNLPSGDKAICLVCIPGWDATAGELEAIKDSNTLADATVAHWNEVMRSSMRVEIPDKLLRDVIMGSQVHCYLAARNEDYRYIAPWIAAVIYGPFESEAQAIIQGMEATGNMDFARRGLEYYIKRYNKQGFLTTGYTVMGTGWHLWALGEYYQLTKDRQWLKSNADEIARVCKWVMAQREKTKRLDALGNKVPEYGLMPPGVVADWQIFCFYYSLNSFYYAGLNAAGHALDEIGYSGAKDMIASAEELRKSITRAFHWTQSLAPVYPLQDGTWVPAYPTHVYCPAPMGDHYKGQDQRRSWAYDVELGASHLISQGVIDPRSKDAAWLIDHSEDWQFLQPGWIWGGEAYSIEKVRGDWFNLGGFAKVQPYYARTADIYALQDDVKAFLRTYFNTISAHLNREDLSLWEHFGNGVFNKTHETSYFLRLSRMMFATERGDQLWLAPFVTCNWLKDGEEVTVSNVPSRYGGVSYGIASHVNEGYIEASIAPLTREQPKEIVLRLRHPDGKRMRSVTIDGKPSTSFDPAAETVTIKPGHQPIMVKASY